MSCDAVAKLIPLYFYGELEGEEEERVEEHLQACAGCAREMERQRELAATLDRRAVEVPPFLLEECRADLMATVECGAEAPERRAAAPVSKGPWTLFLEALSSTFAGFTRWRQPVGAMALVAIGFFAAKFTATNPGAAQKTPSASPSDEVYATVRSVQADPSGAVTIAFDETRRREISGGMDDQNIQRLLLAAAREENPAVRVESVDVLKERAGSADVRGTLLNTLMNDPSDAVRMKALEALKPLAGDPQVRRTLAHVLVTDRYAPMRMQAVDLLTAHRDDSVVGVFQGLVQQENQPYVRQRLQQALREWNASVGTF